MPIIKINFLVLTFNLLLFKDLNLALIELNLFLSCSKL